MKRGLVVAYLLALAVGGLIWALARTDGPEPDRPSRRPEPLRNVEPSPEFVDRQKSLSRILLSESPARQKAEEILELAPLSDYEGRRIVSMLETYRGEEAREVVRRLVDADPSLTDAYLGRWLRQARGN